MGEKIEDPNVGDVVRHVGSVEACDILIIDKEHKDPENIWVLYSWRRILPNGGLGEVERGRGDFEKTDTIYREQVSKTSRKRGRTTALAFKTIAFAMRDKGKWIKIIDHHPRGHYSLLQKIKEIAHNEKLEGFEYEKSGSYYAVRYNPYYKRCGTKRNQE